MNDKVLLLSAIRRDPDCDVVRLVYADLLDELGGLKNTARARFIRQQIAGEPVMVPLTVLSEAEDILGCQAHQAQRSGREGECDVCVNGELRLKYTKGMKIVTVPQLSDCLLTGEHSGHIAEPLAPSPWLLAVLRAHPDVVEVRAIGLRPVKDGRFYWGRNTHGSIPPKVFDLMGGEVVRTMKYYPTAAAAISALGNAVVRWGVESLGEGDAIVTDEELNVLLATAKPARCLQYEQATRTMLERWAWYHEWCYEDDGDRRAHVPEVVFDRIGGVVPGPRHSYPGLIAGVPDGYQPPPEPRPSWSIYFDTTSAAMDALREAVRKYNEDRNRE